MNLPKISVGSLQGKYFLLSTKNKALAMLTLTIALVVTLSLALGKTAFDQIMSLRDEITHLSQSNLTLQNKVQVLSSIDENTLSNQAQTATLAVPSQVPSLPTLLSLRTIAAQRGVVVSDFRVSEKSDKKTEKRIEVTLSVFGSLEGVLGFLDEIKNYPPVMRVVNANITYAPGTTIARVTIDSVYSPAPADIGKAETPLEALKSTDLEIIKQFEQFSQQQNTIIIPEQPAGKTNPFE